MNIFDSSEKTIGELFSSNTIYIIPNYQRPYSWEERHVEDLWKDVLDTVAQAKSLRKDFPGYFIGTIYIRNVTDFEDLDEHLKMILKGSENVFGRLENAKGQDLKFIELLDGQQRLITLFLLREQLNLSNWLTLKNGHRIACILPAIQDREFLLKLVNSENNNHPIPLTYSQRKLQATQEFWLRNMTINNLPNDIDFSQISHASELQIIICLFRNMLSKFFKVKMIAVRN
jgi:uncharacterized protein with ParB-like and HNH nuclease domain